MQNPPLISETAALLRIRQELLAVLARILAGYW